MAWPWWVLIVLGTFIAALVAWAAWGFGQAWGRLRKAVTAADRAGARLYLVIVGMRLTLAVAVGAMLTWTLAKG